MANAILGRDPKTVKIFIFEQHGYTVYAQYKNIDGIATDLPIKFCGTGEAGKKRADKLVEMLTEEI